MVRWHSVPWIRLLLVWFPRIVPSSSIQKWCERYDSSYYRFLGRIRLQNLAFLSSSYPMWILCPSDLRDLHELLDVGNFRFIFRRAIAAKFGGSMIFGWNCWQKPIHLILNRRPFFFSLLSWHVSVSPSSVIFFQHLRNGWSNEEGCQTWRRTHCWRT